MPSSGQDWRWDPEVGSMTGAGMHKTWGIHEDSQAASWSPTFVNLLVFNTCVYVCACVSTIGACVCQHEGDILTTCDLCHTYLCIRTRVFTRAGVFVCVYTLQRGCKAPGDGSDGRMKIQRIQVNSHLHVRCRLRHITHPAGCGEGSSLLEFTVSFLGSSDCH